LTEIGVGAFWNCQHLQSVIIPASVTVLGSESFRGCRLLHSVEFVSDSQLTEIGCSAFWECLMLQSIGIPSSVETIGESCFRGCSRLATVTLLPNSKLVRIERFPFYGCFQLASFAVPSSVIFIGALSFAGCSSIPRLEFACPSRVGELLSLPRSGDGLTEIPDSVEILSFVDELEVDCGHVLEFGSESKLKQIKHTRSLRGLRRCFVRLTSRALKAFRLGLEFEGSFGDCRVCRIDFESGSRFFHRVCDTVVDGHR
jgi:hypothetical protein